MITIIITHWVEKTKKQKHIETGNRDRRQETGDRRQEIGDKRQETRDKRKETRDRKQKTGDKRQTKFVISFILRKARARPAQDKRQKIEVRS